MSRWAVRSYSRVLSYFAPSSTLAKSLQKALSKPSDAAVRHVGLELTVDDRLSRQSVRYQSAVRPEDGMKMLCESCRPFCSDERSKC